MKTLLANPEDRALRHWRIRLARRLYAWARKLHGLPKYAEYLLHAEVFEQAAALATTPEPREEGDADDGTADSSTDVTEGPYCICRAGFKAESLDCPVHGRSLPEPPERCPTCGSDDPGWHREPHYGCLDPFHTPRTNEEAD